ncbi:MAG: L-serine ammonia-lyase, iron-sulfur-dependent, subunit alpha [Spirochaetaceae bacterium]|jgi:L-cysteine desulfidase|nr:L-serine ammonia-lyase, iron-sulfur-dependent, subunit alpha [Spirochaetaceae bacterium]
MNTIDPRYANYFAILKEELVAAMGCTEPAAIAFAAARAREELGALPERVTLIVSGNIIKNVRSVVVPHTGGLHGIKAAVAAGVIAGNSAKKLEVIDGVTSAEQPKIKQFLDNIPISLEMSSSENVLEIDITVYKGSSKVRVLIIGSHTNISRIEKDGVCTFQGENLLEHVETDRSLLSVEGILDYAETVDINEVRPLIERQIEYNSAISAEGLLSNWGANIGSVLLTESSDNPQVRARAAAAAGSDARMSGCELPVIILSGSGNQGMTASLPVIEYAKTLQSDHETLIRALVLSSLITIHLKTGIGRLSAYCGVVSAGAAAGAGIAYLHGGRFEEIAHTIVNALAITSGIVCDGAKPSCAAKIASAVDAGILGYKMFKNGQQFYGGEGLVARGLEETIANISRLGRVGMQLTDKEIINIMLHDE